MIAALAALLLCLLCACAPVAARKLAAEESARAADRKLIVNGFQTILTGRYPYMASLRNPSLYDTTSSHTCGGTLIAPRLVLTAAHCFTLVEWRGNPQVYFGGVEYDSIIDPVAFAVGINYTIHELYNIDAPSDLDVALLLLDREVTTVSPVPLVSASAQLDDGQLLTTIGWGLTSQGGSSPAVLQDVAVPYMGSDTCATTTGYSYANITSNMFCAGGDTMDSCQGDSGGPIIIDGQDATADMQAGIVSFGEGCAIPGYPGVYTSIAAVREWIDNTAMELTGSPIDSSVPGFSSEFAPGYSSDYTPFNPDSAYAPAAF